MTTTTDLEATLSEAWTLDNLAVYGDHLMSLGDPRGDLIAADLHLARDGSTPEVERRRRRAIRAWLGLAASVDPTRGRWASVTFAFGFIDDLRADLASQILSSPAGPYVRGITLSQKSPAISWLLHEIAAAPRPWLERLTLLHRSTGRPPTAAWTVGAGALSDVAIGPLIAATPRLSRFELAGHRMLRAFPHPGVRVLRVDGIDALLTILQPGQAMPSVTELELAFAHAHGEPVVMQRPWPTLVPAECFPALRRLDLSANDQHATTDTQIGVLDVLPTLGVLDQLEELRLPALLELHEHAMLRRVIARMPRLRQIEIEHGPRELFEVEGVQVIAVQPRWPRDAGVVSTVWLRIPGDPLAFELPLRGVIRFCSHVRARFDEAVMANWEEVWQTFEVLAYGSWGYGLPSTTLRVALGALGYLDASIPDLRPWAALRERLQALTEPIDVWVSWE